MGICWGSPDFPTPSFGRHGTGLNISSWSDTTSSAVATSQENTATSDGPLGIPEEFRVFKFSELKAATMNFSFLFGEASFDGKDIIFRGWLGQGRVQRGLLIKLIKLPSNPSTSQQSIMRAKFESYGSQSHANLARLLGYCMKGKKVFLVFESLQHCFSLDDHLYKSEAYELETDKALPAIPWEGRLKIALEAARGLYCLHLMNYTFLEYFQASYVFLDESYAVKIAPFNFLATTESENSRSTRNKNAHAAVTAYRRRRQDVYDFGVVLLEILTGLPLGRNRQSPEYGLRIEWVRKRILEKQNLASMMDSSMGSYSYEKALRVAELAVHCLAKNPPDRPDMELVKDTLRLIKARGISPDEQHFRHEAR